MASGPHKQQDNSSSSSYNSSSHNERCNSTSSSRLSGTSADAPTTLHTPLHHCLKHHALISQVSNKQATLMSTTWTKQLHNSSPHRNTKYFYLNARSIVNKNYVFVFSWYCLCCRVLVVSPSGVKPLIDLVSSCYNWCIVISPPFRYLRPQMCKSRNFNSSQYYQPEKVYQSCS